MEKSFLLFSNNMIFPAYYGCSGAIGDPSNVYHLSLPHSDTYTDVYCDQVTDGGRWTVMILIMLYF